MQLFGLNIAFSKNGKYIKKEECHLAQDNIKEHINDFRLELKTDIQSVHKRIDEIFTILLEKK